MIPFALIIFAIAAAAIIYPLINNRKLENRIKAFATSQGWASNTESPLVPAMQKQKYRSDKSMIEGTLEGLRFWFYACQPPTVQIRQEAGTSSAIYMLSVKVPINLPDLLLAPHVGGVTGIAYDDMASSAFHLVKMTLEGDFSEHVGLFGEGLSDKCTGVSDTECNGFN